MENNYETLDNKIIKENAKDMIRGNLWSFWSLTIVIGLITYLLDLIPSIILGSSASALEGVFSASAQDIPREANLTGSVWYYIITAILGIVVIPLNFGYQRNVNLWARGVGQNRWTILFECYKFPKKFFKAIGIAIFSSIIISLACLLLVIPSIIMAISYSMASYIMFDEPELSVVQVLKKSRKMMKGYKGKFFLLLLGFLGWVIVGALTFGILYIWLMPYFSSAIALFYDDLRRSYNGGADPARPIEEDSIDDEPRRENLL